MSIELGQYIFNYFASKEKKWLEKDEKIVTSFMASHLTRKQQIVQMPQIHFISSLVPKLELLRVEIAIMMVIDIDNEKFHEL